MKAKVFLFSSLVFLVVSAIQFSDRYYPTTTAISQSEIIKEDDQINLPAIGIRLPIIEREVGNDKPWPISKTSVIKIKDKNIYYGHNWPRLLGDLSKSQLNDQIDINFNGVKTSYLVTNIQEVHNSDSEILKSLREDQIIIYTCSGFLDKNRFVVIANSKK